MIKEIKINGTVFSYDEKNLTYDTVCPITEDEGKKILQKTKELFGAVSLDFCLIYGTLLGAVRDKTIIKGDEDIDIYIEDERKLLNNLFFFKENGLILIRMIKGHLYTFSLNDDYYIDVYILRPIRTIIYLPWAFHCCFLSAHVMPKRFFKEKQSIEFLGDIYYCPKNPQELIKYIYGENWRTPVQGHKVKYRYEVISANKWRIFLHNCKEFVKGLLGKEVNYWHR